jgi:hypothetical protein
MFQSAQTKKGVLFGGFRVSGYPQKKASANRCTKTLFSFFSEKKKDPKLPHYEDLIFFVNCHIWTIGSCIIT